MIAESSIALPQTEKLSLQKHFKRITQSTVIKADSASQKISSSFCAEPSQIPQGFIINCAPPHTLLSLGCFCCHRFRISYRLSLHNWDLSGEGNVFPSIFTLCPVSLVPCSLGNFLFACFLIFFYIFFQRVSGEKEWHGGWMPFFHHSETVCQTHLGTLLLNLWTTDLLQELVDSLQGRQPWMQLCVQHTHLALDPDSSRHQERQIQNLKVAAGQRNLGWEAICARGGMNPSG